MTAGSSSSASNNPAKRRSTQNPVALLAAHAVDAALDKKAHDVTVLDMRGVSGVADVFVVATGDSDLQVRAILEAVEKRIKETCRERPWHVEGKDHWQWVLLDYVDLVVHIFNPEKRAFYDLERLWGDAPKYTISDDGDATEVDFLREAYEEAGTDTSEAG